MTAPAEPYATKSDFAYTRVRELILSGELGPGAVINQALLAKEIGISTTPLREALRRLMQQGLVELDAHRDARVTQLDAEEARDLLEVRRSLDPLAAGLAAERRTKADLAELRAGLDGLGALPTNPTLAQLNAHDIPCGPILSTKEIISDASLADTNMIVTVDHPERGKYRVPTALSLLVFFALCCPCASTLAVIRRETRSWAWPAFTFAYMTTLAYVGALVTFQVGRLIIG